MIARRQLLLTGGAHAAVALAMPAILRFGWSGSAHAQATQPDASAAATADAAGTGLNDPLPPVPKELEPYVGYADMAIEDIRNLGTKEPPSERNEMALKIINEALNAQENRTPYEFALWFRDMGQGKFGPERAPYARAWPVYFNPIVVEAFRATDNFKPEGDTTPWCAAFVNFCIILSAMKKAGHSSYPQLRHTIASDLKAYGSRSPSSGSFRCWPSGSNSGGVSAPQLGDVVCWARRHSVNGCAYGQGHVAFFEGFDGDRIIVVGGNQGPKDTDRQTGVTRRTFGQTYNTSSYACDFHSFRRSEVLI